MRWPVTSESSSCNSAIILSVSSSAWQSKSCMEGPASVCIPLSAISACSVWHSISPVSAIGSACVYAAVSHTSVTPVCCSVSVSSGASVCEAAVSVRQAMTSSCSVYVPVVSIWAFIGENDCRCCMKFWLIRMELRCISTGKVYYDMRTCLTLIR